MRRKLWLSTALVAVALFAVFAGSAVAKTGKAGAVGGTLNVSVNCVDRHVQTARRNKAALIWEGEPGDRRTLTYWDLYREVKRFAAATYLLPGPTMRSTR